MRATTILPVFLLAFLAVGEVLAQGGSTPLMRDERTRMQFGIRVDGQLGLPTAEFVGLPGMASCQGDTTFFSPESSGGVNILGLFGFRPTETDMLGWNIGVGIAFNSTSFEAQEYIGRSLSPSGEIDNVVSRYTLDASLTRLLIEPKLLVRPIADQGLLIGVGPAIDLLIGATYEQSEAISEPSDATYPDGQRVRNEFSGDIQETNGLQLGGLLSLGWDIDVSPGLSLRPTLGYRLGIGDIAADTDWQHSEARIGLALLLNPVLFQSTPLAPSN